MVFWNLSKILISPSPLVLFKSSCCRPELVELQVHMHLCVLYVGNATV